MVRNPLKKRSGGPKPIDFEKADNAFHPERPSRMSQPIVDDEYAIPGSGSDSDGLDELERELQDLAKEQGLGDNEVNDSDHAQEQMSPDKGSPTPGNVELDQDPQQPTPKFTEPPSQEPEKLGDSSGEQAAVPLVQPLKANSNENLAEDLKTDKKAPLIAPVVKRKGLNMKQDKLAGGSKQDKDELTSLRNAQKELAPESSDKPRSSSLPDTQQPKKDTKAKKSSSVLPEDTEVRPTVKTKVKEEKAPRCKSAFLFFCEEKRPELKETKPELKMTEYMVELSKMWKAEDSKEKYQDMAATDKESKSDQIAEFKKSHQKPTKSEATKEGSAYQAFWQMLKDRFNLNTKSMQIFCTEQGPTLEAQGAEPEDLQKMLGFAWKVADQAKYKKLAKKRPSVESKASGPEIIGTSKSGDVAPLAKMAAKKTKGSRASKRGGKSEDKEPEATGDSSDSDEDPLFKDFDPSWEVEAIISETKDSSQFLVKAKGQSFADCGLVNARVAKRQRHEGNDDTCPVTVQAIDEYERFVKKFKHEIRDHSVDGGLDLDDLAPDTSLEMCSLVYKLRTEDGHMLQRQCCDKKRDLMISVPAMQMALLIQRLVSIERQKADAHKRAAEASSARFGELQQQHEEAVKLLKKNGIKMK
eukprot:gene13399-19249_t